MTVMGTRELIVRADGVAVNSGLEQGHMTVAGYGGADLERKTILIHEAGSSFWSGRGQPSSYAGAQWHVGIVESIERWDRANVEAFKLKVRYVASFPVTSNHVMRDEGFEKAWKRLETEAQFECGEAIVNEPGDYFDLQEEARRVAGQ